ncbi:hypothetical protein C8R46DRAFT_61669 [Mycena filopes]|nr:hypothetical protein C8R46DRAFT_61669 [Mycena filopes]
MPSVRSSGVEIQPVGRNMLLNLNGASTTLLSLQHRARLSCDILRGANREGMLNTNNWTERAFKTFQQVFLCNRANKSVYRLVLIIANEFYEYYRAWQPTQKKIDRQAIDLAAEAHQIWSTGHGVQEVRLEDGRRLFMIRIHDGKARVCSLSSWACGSAVGRCSGRGRGTSHEDRRRRRRCGRRRRYE